MATITTLRRVALTGVLALGVAAPSASAATAVDKTAVAAGKLEHTVSRVTVSGSRAVPSDVRTHVYVAANASRSLTRDVKSGKLVSETASGPGGSFTWDAETNKVRFTKKATGPAYGSFAADAANLRAQVADKALVETGRTVVGTRQALVLGVGPAYRTSDPGTEDVVVVDAASFALISRTTTAPGGVFVQKVVVERAETLELAGNKKFLKLGKHKAAKRARG